MTAPPTPPPTPPTEPSSLARLPQYPLYPQAQPGGVLAPPPYQLAHDPSTNGFAIAALVLGIVGGVPLSVLFGIIALVQISKRGQQGKGLAIGGLVLSGVWLVGFAVLVIAVLANTPARDDSGTLTSDGSLSVEDLHPGDCVNDVRERSLVESLPAVPCSTPHEGEVFAVFDLTGATYPGKADVAQRAEQGCAERFDEYAPDADNVEDLDLFYLYPVRSSWSRGDHRVTCFAIEPTGTRTGSLRD